MIYRFLSLYSVTCLARFIGSVIFHDFPPLSNERIYQSKYVPAVALWVDLQSHKALGLANNQTKKMQRFPYLPA